MLVRRQDRKREVNVTGMRIFDYPLPLGDLGVSYQELEGRIPRQGNGANTVCEECYYVLEGSVEVYIAGEKFDANVGDMVIIQPGKPSYLVAKGLKMLTITSPDWYEEQHQITE